MRLRTHTRSRPRSKPAGGFFFFAAVFAPCTGLLAAAAADGPAAAPGHLPPPRVQFAAAVSVDYARGLPLRGWDNTCRIIQATLTAWQTGTVTQAVVRNPTPDGLRQFLQNLQGPEGGIFQVVYLAARHTPDGAWRFTRSTDGSAAWSSLLRSPAPAHPGRLAILDVCHAGAVAEQPAWRAGLAPATTLLASTREELTFEFDFTNRQPIDLPARYPAALAWLRQHLPADWDGRLSNLGLTWTLAFLRTPQPPQTLQDWQAFFGRCEAEARLLQKALGPQHASTVSQSPPAP